MKMTEESQKPTLSLITICKTVQMESKQSTSFWVVPVENSYKEKYFWKGCPVFLLWMFQTEIHIPFLRSYLRLSLPFYGKWSWYSVEMVKTIPEWNLPVQNFAFHLPRRHWHYENWVYTCFNKGWFGIWSLKCRIQCNALLEWPPNNGFQGPKHDSQSNFYWNRCTSMPHPMVEYVFPTWSPHQIN